MLGANLVLAALDRCEVIAHAYPPALQPMGFASLASDLTADGEADRVVREARPDWVIHCAAQADVDACERDPGGAMRLNVDLAGSVAAAAARAGARLVHISTDAVFDGTKGDYRERDTPAPVNTYGLSKLRGEAAVARMHPRASIVRTNFFTWPAPGKLGLAGWFLERLERGEPCAGFIDAHFSPLLGSTLAGIVLDLLTVGAGGVMHAASRTCLSKYEFGVQLAQAFSLESSLIHPDRSSSAGLAAVRGQRLCLNPGKLERVLGRRMPTVGEELKRFRQERDGGVPDALRAIRAEGPASPA
jgi:dTDP-4-dehydrorhamnose reductase